MRRSLARFRGPLILALALIGPVLVYRAHARDPHRINTVDRVLLAVTAPVQRLLVGAVGALSDVWFFYADLAEARRREGVLRRALLDAERKRAALEALEKENEHLRTLLELKRRNPDHRLAAARVIGARLDPGVGLLTIDKGAMDGIRGGLPVVSGAGLVGRVVEVAWTTADLQLIADPRVSIPAKILRTGARGRLRGRGGDFRLVLSEILRSDDLRRGDRVVTSGLGGMYPVGIPIGTVTRLFTEKGVPHRFADVAPSVDFDRIEAVSVVVTAAKDVPVVTPELLLPPELRERPSEVPDGGIPDSLLPSFEDGRPEEDGRP